MIKIRVKNSYLVGLLVFTLLAGAAFWLFNRRAAEESCGEDYQWLNPRLQCQEKPVISKAGYVVFRNKLKDEIENMKKEGKVEEAAVFFRDLEAGPTFGIKDREKFIPASLLKVPIALTYYKLAEDDPDLLKKELIFDSQLAMRDLPQTILPGKMLELDKPYAIDELIHRMIAYSDNRAMLLLQDYLRQSSPDTDLVGETYLETGIIDPKEDVNAAVITVKSYASLFRLLYNVSYLSNEYSQKLLGYLTEAVWADGLRKGVPNGIAIAHKFGERKFPGVTAQLHDCGIVYYPKNPYLLCVMTRGTDIKNLAEAISEISKAVYEEINSRRL